MDGEVRLNRNGIAGLAFYALTAVTAAVPLGAQTDEWFARDKALHFGASAAIAAAAYGVAALHFDCRAGRTAVGGATALAAGIGKEVFDRTGDGVASWKDLAWDVVGTATGLAIAAIVDGPDSCSRGGPVPGGLQAGARSPKEPLVLARPRTATGERGAATITAGRSPPPPPYSYIWFDLSTRR